MGRKRREGVYQRKRGALADASELVDGDITALLDDLDAEAVAADVAREMSASPVRPITSEEIEQREFDAILRELEREQRQQARDERERQRRDAEAARRAAQAREAAKREARERMAQQTRVRQVEADRERLEQLEQRARAQAAADLQRHQEGIAAAKQQRVQTAYQNLMQTFDRILRPDELPPQPAEPYQGSPHFGSPDFSPDAAIARFQPWKPWQP